MMAERSRKNLKIGVGIFLIVVAIANLSIDRLPYQQFMEQQAVTIAYLIAGILIILGTGKIKELLRLKSKSPKPI